MAYYRRRRSFRRSYRRSVPYAPSYRPTSESSRTRLGQEFWRWRHTLRDRADDAMNDFPDPTAVHIVRTPIGYQWHHGEL